MQYTEFLRIERVKKILDIVAYGSLAIDVGIAVVTLISLRIYSQELNSIQSFLITSLTVEVIVTMVLFLALVLLYRYEQVTDNLARLSMAIKGKKKKRT